MSRTVFFFLSYNSASKIFTEELENSILIKNNIPLVQYYIFFLPWYASRMCNRFKLCYKFLWHLNLLKGLCKNCVVLHIVLLWQQSESVPLLGALYFWIRFSWIIQKYLNLSVQKFAKQMHLYLLKNHTTTILYIWCTSLGPMIREFVMNKQNMFSL